MVVRSDAAFRTGILTVACITLALWTIGCESSNQMAASPTNPACPLCGHEAQVQPLNGLDYAKAVCATCEQVSTVDPQFLDRLEIFTGGPIGDTVYACASCRTVVTQCAVCRQNGGSLARRSARNE
jgi:hypothetical protein